MRCPVCGQPLKERIDLCPRCKAEISPSARLQRARVSLVYAAIAIAFIALLTFAVLMWHDSQFAAMP